MKASVEEIEQRILHIAPKDNKDKCQKGRPQQDHRASLIVSKASASEEIMVSTTAIS